VGYIDLDRQLTAGPFEDAVKIRAIVGQISTRRVTVSVRVWIELDAQLVPGFGLFGKRLDEFLDNPAEPVVGMDFKGYTKAGKTVFQGNG
jgi:hypothetical protein